MEAAAILALGLQDWIDAGVIIGILMLNAIVGWYQEKQAADVVASLKGDIAMKARVVRNGQEQEIRARELVPGDIVSSELSCLGGLPLTELQVVIEEGTVVPADTRLICDYEQGAEGFQQYKVRRLRQI